MKKNYLTIKSLKTPFIKYGFFTRTGGCSKKNYTSLNCSLTSGDSKKHVNKNIKKVMKELNISNKKLKLIKQTHSSNIIKVNINNFDTKHVADGLITSSNDIALAVLTADCAPIFLFNIQQKFICCLHSGWKGALKNIPKKAVTVFNKNQIKNSDIVAIVGPCLSAKNFEVDLNFKKKFIQQNSVYANFFKPKNKTKEYFNMRGLINFQLYELGISQIYNVNKDTYSNDSLFFSHRRSVHLNKNKAGRMINIISFT